MIISLNNKLRTSSSAPTYIGSVEGRKFYENPWQGDEAPMIERVGEGAYISTDYWELEDAYQDFHPLAS